MAAFGDINSWSRSRARINHDLTRPDVTWARSNFAPGLHMDINRFKRAASGTTVAAVCLATSWVVAQAVPSSPMDALLKTQREVTVTALETAIARGDDGIGPLPGFYLPDDADLQADDPL